MSKIFQVACRDFWATVSSKGFLIAIALLPGLIALSVSLLPELMREEPPVLSGEVALIDGSGAVADHVARRLVSGGRGELNLDLVELEPTTDLEGAKRSLLGDGRRVALAVVDANAVEPEAGESSYGSYRLFLRRKVDHRVERLIDGALRDALVETRARANGLDPRLVENLLHVQRWPTATVTADGEHDDGGAFQVVLPLAFLTLLLMSVMASGQSLMTTTIEEKSSRVIEVLLSAVSPFELMTGKIVGQLWVGLLILAVYGGIGLVALERLALLSLLDTALVGYLLIFFLIAYIVVGSLMAAIGAAVSELRDAQALFTPVMLLVLLPWMLAAPLSDDPTSPLSVILSFVPPMNCFAMLVRLASAYPPPAWQVLLSIGFGVAGAGLCLWFASRVFRVGLLVQGKPPNLATLVRWVREQ